MILSLLLNTVYALIATYLYSRNCKKEDIEIFSGDSDKDGFIFFKNLFWIISYV